MAKIIFEFQISDADIRIRKTTAKAGQAYRNRKAYTRREKHRQDWRAYAK